MILRIPPQAFFEACRDPAKLGEIAAAIRYFTKLGDPQYAAVETLLEDLFVAMFAGRPIAIRRAAIDVLDELDRLSGGAT